MKKQSEIFQKSDAVAWEKIGDGIERQIMGYDKNVMIVKIKFDKNAKGEMHSHEHSQATYVVSGKFEAKIGSQSKILSEGDGFYVAPNEIHGVACLESGVLIDVFSPYREDFL